MDKELEERLGKLLEGLPQEKRKAIEEFISGNYIPRETKVLEGILPICGFCKKIRDDKDHWVEIESYISAHSEAEFSHGVCPNCMEEQYPEVSKLIDR